MFGDFRAPFAFVDLLGFYYYLIFELRNLKCCLNIFRFSHSCFRHYFQKREFSKFFVWIITKPDLKFLEFLE